MEPELDVGKEMSCHNSNLLAAFSFVCNLFCAMRIHALTKSLEMKRLRLVSVRSNKRTSRERRAESPRYPRRTSPRCSNPCSPRPAWTACWWPTRSTSTATASPSSPRRASPNSSWPSRYRRAPLVAVPALAEAAASVACWDYVTTSASDSGTA